MIDSRGRDTAALYAIDVATGEKKLVFEDARADIGNALADPRTGVVAGRGGRLPARGVEGAGSGDRRRPEETAGDRPGRSRRQCPHLRRQDLDRRLLGGRSAGRLLPLRPCRRRQADQAVLRASGARRQAAGSAVAAGDQVARRHDPGQLPDPAAERRRQRRRQGRRAGADGAAGARRPVGARQLRLQPAPPVAGQPRLRGAAGELPRLDRLRQGVHQRRQRRVGGKMHDDLLDAVQWAVDKGVTTKDQVAIMGGSYGGYATLVGADVHAGRVRVRRRHRRPVEPQHAAEHRARRTGPASTSSWPSAWATRAPRTARSGWSSVRR